MTQVREIKRYTGGINTDVDKSLLPEGDVIDARNCEVSEIDGAAVNKRGTTARTTYKYGYLFASLPGDEIKSIGTFENKESNTLIHFLCTTFGYSYIVSYDPAEEEHTVICDVLALGFSQAHPIRGANVVGGILYWTDAYNPPRKINIQKAINYTNGLGGDAYTTITAETLSAAIYAPKTAPAVSFGTDVSFGRNNLRGKSFQFCFRYLTHDDEYTVTSQFSKIPLPQNGEDYDGFVSSVVQNNFLSVGVLVGGELIKEVEVFAREGSTGSWYRIAKINKEQLGLPDSSTHVHTVKFYNNQHISVADQDDINTVTDNVPLYVDFQEVLDEGRIVYFGVTEGREQTEINLSLAPALMSAEYDNPGAVVKTFAITFGSDATSDYYEIKIIPGSPTNDIPSLGEMVNFSVDLLYENDPYGLPEELNFSGFDRPGGSDLASAEDFANWLLGFINGVVGGYLFPEKQGADTIWLRYYFPPVAINIAPTLTSTGAGVEAVGKKGGFKIGASHPVGIVYFDDSDRNGGVCVSAGEDAYMPFHTEIYDEGTILSGGPAPHQFIVGTTSSWRDQRFFECKIEIDDGVGGFVTRTIIDVSSSWLVLDSGPGFDPSGKAYRIYAGGVQGARKRGIIRWEVRHLPPIWAKKWMFVYAGNQSVASFVQYPITGVLDGTKYTEIDITWLNQHNLGGTYEYPSSSVVPYEFIRGSGDRIRFITKDNTTGDPASPLRETLSEYVDIDIVSYKDDDPTTNILLVKKFDWATPEIGTGSLAEIYTPKLNTEDKVYYGIGDVYEIGSPGTANRYHKGEFQDQTPSDPINFPAKGTLADGGAYVYPRSFSAAPDGVNRTDLVESQHMSDLYDSADYAKGKAFVVLPNPQTKKYRFGRWSNRYFADSPINGLNKFESANRTRQLNEEYGEITGLQRSGFTLRVFQERQISSIYIGRSVIESDGGDGETITTSNAVLGTIRPQVYGGGTALPHSLCTFGSWTYFFDIYNGKVCRLANNGVEVISDIGMRNYFRNKSRGLLESGIDNIDILMVYDRIREALIVTFLDSVTPANNDTVVFSESRKRWVSFMDFVPDMYGTVGDRLFSFKALNMYEHELDGVDRMKYYGVQYDFDITFVSNIGSDSLRTLEALDIDTNNNKFNTSDPTYSWYVPEITVDANERYPYGQRSRIPAGHFITKQGRLYSDVLRDIYTTGPKKIVTSKDLKVGRKMLSNVFDIQLHHENPELVTLSSMRIYSSLAKKS